MTSILKYSITPLLILSSGACLSQKSSTEIQEEKSPPNIIVILADDQGYADLSYSSFSKEEVQTPNIDKLVESGMFFTDAHTSGMICAPTRAGLLTGRYQQRLGYWVGAHQAGVSGKEMMIP